MKDGLHTAESKAEGHKKEVVSRPHHRPFLDVPSSQVISA